MSVFRYGLGVLMRFSWLVVLLPAFPVFAAKTDTVVLENGNLITGEIKALEYGKLRYSTDSMGTVMIEWDEIARIASNLSFTVEVRDGNRFLGALAPSGDNNQLIVEGAHGRTLLELNDVVKIQHIEDNFWDRVDTYLSAGYSYSKASDITDFKFGLEMVHTNERGVSALNAISLITDDGEEEKKYNRALLEHRRFRPNRKYWLGLLGAEQNDELGVDYRLVGGGGIGKYFFQTNLHQLSSDIGLVAVQTESKDGTSDQDVEGLWRATYRIYDYDTPKTSLVTSLSVFNGITNSGEYRINYDIVLRKELITDLFWDISFFSRYQSDTADEEASSTDYGISTSVGLEL
jgi:hypothetical protein